MKDEFILKMAEAATAVLGRTMGPSSVDNLIPSYNLLISSAQQNHLEDPFLSKLSPIVESTSPPELAVLFAQLRLAVEAANEGSE